MAASIAITITAFFFIKLPTPRCRCKWFVNVTPFQKNILIIQNTPGFVKMFKQRRDINICLSNSFPKTHNLLAPSLRGLSAKLTGGVSYLKEYTPSVKNRFRSTDFCHLPQRGRQGRVQVRSYLSNRNLTKKTEAGANAIVRPCKSNFICYSAITTPRERAKASAAEPAGQVTL